jgi:hypothetical protein
MVKSRRYEVSHYVIFSILVSGPNILLSALFSDILNLRSSSTKGSEPNDSMQWHICMNNKQIVPLCSERWSLPSQPLLCSVNEDSRTVTILDTNIQHLVHLSVNVTLRPHIGHDPLYISIQCHRHFQVEKNSYNKHTRSEHGSH